MKYALITENQIKAIEAALEELMYSNSTHIAAEKFCEALAAARELREMEPVASIYIAINGEREFDDWKCKLPTGRTELYALGDEK